MAHAKRNPRELRRCGLQSACRINRELVSWQGKKRPTTAHFGRLLSHAREKKKTKSKTGAEREEGRAGPMRVGAPAKEGGLAYGITIPYSG